MQTERIISLINNYNVPIFFFDEATTNEDYCHAIIIPSESLAEIRGIKKETTIEKNVGVHIFRCDEKTLYADFLRRNLPAVYARQQQLQSCFSIEQSDIPLAFTLFTILHEIGHMIHIQESQLSHADYWFRNNASRDDVWKLYQFCNSAICHTPQEKSLLLTFVNQIYDNIPSEKFANQFAEKEFEINWSLLKEGDK